MSLINDALKRVKEAQHKDPPSASLGPQLRPVEPEAAPTHHALGWLLPVALAGVALLTLLLVWELARKENSPVAVRAQVGARDQSASTDDTSLLSGRSSETTPPVGSAIPETAATPVAARSAASALVTASNSPISNPLTNSSLGVQVKASPVSETAANTNSGTAQAPDATGPAGMTNPSIAEVQPPTPPPLKLQGIVFSKRPSAVISGKTVFVGDRVHDFRVLAITQDTAVLVGAGRTNVLSLSD